MILKREGVFSGFNFVSFCFDIQLDILTTWRESVSLTSCDTPRERADQGIWISMGFVEFKFGSFYPEIGYRFEDITFMMRFFMAD